jgi:hypothetical protein
VLLARLQVLADRQDRQAELAELVEHLEHLVALLAEPEHQARLDQRAALAGPPQHRVRAVVAGLHADLAAQPRDRLEVVGEHVGARVEHGVDVGEVALEVGDQHLDRHVRGLAVARVQRLGPDARAAVGQVVAVDRRDHRVRQLERGQHGRHALRLAEVDRQRPPVLTSQNRHERVQMSPRIMIVSARWFQHSPMFGQLAL